LQLRGMTGNPEIDQFPYREAIRPVIIPVFSEISGEDNMTQEQELRIGIVGCGKIADGHAEVLKFLPGAKLVAVCDREILLAEQLAVRCLRRKTWTWYILRRRRGFTWP
jgi:hypothetical protein